MHSIFKKWQHVSVLLKSEFPVIKIKDETADNDKNVNSN